MLDKIKTIEVDRVLFVLCYKFISQKLIFLLNLLSVFDYKIKIENKPILT
jgi:hypothetical protein